MRRRDFTIGLLLAAETEEAKSSGLSRSFSRRGLNQNGRTRYARVSVDVGRKGDLD